MFGTPAHPSEKVIDKEKLLQGTDSTEKSSGERNGRATKSLMIGSRRKNQPFWQAERKTLVKGGPSDSCNTIVKAETKWPKERMEKKKKRKELPGRKASCFAHTDSTGESSYVSPELEKKFPAATRRIQRNGKKETRPCCSAKQPPG